MSMNGQGWTEGQRNTHTHRQAGGQAGMYSRTHTELLSQLQTWGAMENGHSVPHGTSFSTALPFPPILPRDSHEHPSTVDILMDE